MPFKQKINEHTQEIEHEKFPSCFLGESEEEALTLMKEFEYTLNLLSYKYSRLTGLSEDDLKQEALIGLARANRDFDIERSEQFKIFAIYKIKDALNEYVASQSMDVSVPQYLISAVNLINKIYKVLLTFSIDTDGSYRDVWSKSNNFLSPDNIEIMVDNYNKELIKRTVRELTDLLNSLENLALNAKTTVEQLLERAETLPTIASKKDNVSTQYDEDSVLYVDATESTLLNSITTSLLIEEIKSMLSDDDYRLLTLHYVEGKTLRELEKELGIKAPSIAVKIQKITEVIKKRMLKK